MIPSYHPYSSNHSHRIVYQVSIICYLNMKSIFFYLAYCDSSLREQIDGPVHLPVARALSLTLLSSSSQHTHRSISHIRLCLRLVLKYLCCSVFLSLGKNRTNRSFLSSLWRFQSGSESFFCTSVRVQCFGFLLAMYSFPSPLLLSSLALSLIRCLLALDSLYLYTYTYSYIHTFIFFSSCCALVVVCVLFCTVSFLFAFVVFFSSFSSGNMRAWTCVDI